MDADSLPREKDGTVDFEAIQQDPAQAEDIARWDAMIRPIALEMHRLRLSVVMISRDGVEVELEAQ
jgi:hypothetical protein